MALLMACTREREGLSVFVFESGADAPDRIQVFKEELWLCVWAGVRAIFYLCLLMWSRFHDSRVRSFGSGIRFISGLEQFL